MANRSRPVLLSDVDREALERLPRSPSAPAGLTRRGRAVLLMAQQVSGTDIARQTG
jgi:DNA-binding CsgD family transcriptional regulator